MADTTISNERLLGRRVTKPFAGVIEMIYIAPVKAPGATETVVAPVLVVRLDTTGELASYFVNAVHVVEKQEV